MHFPSFSSGGREKSIMRGIEEHVVKVKECVATFEDLVSAAANGDPSAQSLMEKVFKLESEADQMQRELEARIAEGAFFGGVREDILSLIEQVDSVADAAKDSARLLMMGTDGDPSGLAILRNEHMSRFLANLMSALTSLEELVKTIQINRKEIMKGVRMVEEYEEAADTEKAALLAELFRFPRTIDAVTIIQLRDFIFAADDIADNSENASDVLIVLVAKGYG